MVFVDVEGISLVDDVRAVNWRYPELYAQTQIETTLDVNAAIRGLRAAGATEIIVADGHNARLRPDQFNVLRDRLEPDVELVRGVSWLFENAKELDAFTQVGMHCRNGTPIGFMGHTTTYFTAVKFNGEWFGEGPMLSAIAGMSGVPTTLVAGDDATARENRAAMPWIETAIVKTATGRTTCDCLPGDEARAEIEAAAKRSLEKLPSMKPLVVSEPVETEVWFPSAEYADAALTIPGAHRIGETAVARYSDTFMDARKFFSAALQLGGGVSTRRTLKRLTADPAIAQKVHESARNYSETYWAGEPWITVEPPSEA
jgi:D-amino peptidase